VSFEPQHHWQKDKQQLLGSWYSVIPPKIPPMEPTPTILEFDLTQDSAMVSGPCTKFVIQGRFEKKMPAGSWVPTKAEDAKLVTLAPNWFEMLIKTFHVSCNGNTIFTSNEVQSVVPFFNTLLYRLVDAKTKEEMIPQEHHFANCLPPWPKNQWGVHGKTWLDYGAKVLGGGDLCFDYQPLFTFPLHSGTPILPTMLMGKVSFRITFHDSQTHIFRKERGNNAEYRFAIFKFNLMTEQARLAPTFEKSLLSAKRILHYPGVTKILNYENTPEGAQQLQVQIPNIFLPEALLIFTLPREVLHGSYKFSDDVRQSVFEDHRITNVQVQFDNRKIKLASDINDAWFEFKHFIDHIYHPICGLPPDRSGLKIDHFIQGGKETSYPHIYLPLCNFNTKHRMMPQRTDSLEKRGNLDIEITIDEEGCKANLTYFIYAIYTDVGVTFDTRTGLFAHQYLK